MSVDNSANNRSLGTVVTGVIGEDVHIVGIKIIERALNDSGCKVSALGAQVSQEEFIEAAVETNADAILISSFSGHAVFLVHSFRGKCAEAGLGDILIYIGGYLLLKEELWEEVEKTFKNLGMDRVYPPGTSPTKVMEDLKSDILFRRRASK